MNDTGTKNNHEKVFLYEQEEYDVDAICEKVLRMGKDSGLDVGGKSVMLKPSFVYPGRGEHVKGVITQVEFIGGVVRALKQLGASKIFVAENSVVGVARVAFKRGAYLRNFVYKFAELLSDRLSRELIARAMTGHVNDYEL